MADLGVAAKPAPVAAPPPQTTARLHYYEDINVGCPASLGALEDSAPEAGAGRAESDSQLYGGSIAF